MTLRGEVEILADHWRGGATLPVDVDAIAAAAGLRFEYLKLERASGGTCVGLGFAFINADDHPGTRRFTKAHELAHFLFDEPHPESPAPPSWIIGEEWHEAHEYFAASLLMPRDSIRALIASSEPSAPRRTLVNEVARNFGVTRMAAAVRLAEISVQRPAPALYEHLERAERYYSRLGRIAYRAT